MMDSDQGLIAQNKIELQHLISLVERLDEQQLRHPMPAGWTVSAVLAHLAFWDHRALVLIKKWHKEGITPSPMDIDIVNEATRPICLSIPARKAAELAIDCARKIDQAIERLPENWIDQITRDGTTVHLNRGEHRRRHLAEIEKTLGI